MFPLRGDNPHMQEVVRKLPNYFPIGYGPSATKPLATTESLFFFIIFCMFHLHKDRLACDSECRPSLTTRCASAKVCAIHPEVNCKHQKVFYECEGDTHALSQHTTDVGNVVVRVSTNYLVKGLSHVVRTTAFNVNSTDNLQHVASDTSLSREDSECRNRLLGSILDNLCGCSSSSNIQRHSVATQCEMHTVSTLLARCNVCIATWFLLLIENSVALFQSLDDCFSLTTKFPPNHCEILGGGNEHYQNLRSCEKLSCRKDCCDDNHNKNLLNLQVQRKQIEQQLVFGALNQQVARSIHNKIHTAIVVNIKLNTAIVYTPHTHTLKTVGRLDVSTSTTCLDQENITYGRATNRVVPRIVETSSRSCSYAVYRAREQIASSGGYIVEWSGVELR